MQTSDHRSTADWQSQWTFPAGVTYLNHGSFGPTPRSVREAAQRFREELVGNPMEFFCRKQDGYLLEARSRLAGFVGTVQENLLFVENATAGMNLIANAVPLAPGDQVLANDHEYGAVLRIWEWACAKAGAQLVVAQISTPIESSEQVVDTIFASATCRTRLLVVSHVTSPTAVVMPVEAICREARRRGIAVAIDGPHAPAMVPIDLANLGCDFYTASCHKWLSAPFGAGFLYVHPESQAPFEPLVLSWGRTPGGVEGRWQPEFDWAGTRDPAAYLAIPAAIDFLERVGIDEFRSRTHALARYAREVVSRFTGLAPLVPDCADWRGAWYGSMISLPLPAGDGPSLQRAFWERHGIEVPIMMWQGERLLRVSCHLYNEPAHIDRLAAALRGLI